NQQHSLCLRRTCLASWFCGSMCGKDLRKCEHEPRTAARSRAFGTHLSAMLFDLAVRQGQAQAQSAVTAVNTAIRLRKGFENVIDCRSIHPDAGVRHRHEGLAVVSALEADGHLTVAIRELVGIRKQIVHDL